mgnify:FL=1
MPIKPSAIKELRKTKKRTTHNKMVKENIKIAIKKVVKALNAKDSAGAQAAVIAAVKLLDKAASKDIIHANKAGRKKSRLLATVKKASQ